MSIVSVRNYLYPKMALFSQISKIPERLGPQGEEAVINVAYFKMNYSVETKVVPYFILFN